MFRKAAAIILLGISGLAAADGGASGPALLLVPGLYGLHDGATANPSIHPDFLRAIGAEDG